MGASLGTPDSTPGAGRLPARDVLPRERRAVIARGRADRVEVGRGPPASEQLEPATTIARRRLVDEIRVVEVDVDARREVEP